MKDDSIVLRIRKLMMLFGYSQTDFSKKIGIAQSNFSKILSGERSCGDAILNKISISLDINKDWLMTGEGEMLKTNSYSSGSNSINNNYKGTFNEAINTNNVLGHGAKGYAESNSQSGVATAGEYYVPYGKHECPKGIRYWTDVDATAGGIELFDDAISNNYIDLSIPEFRDCTDAVNLYGDSMYPLYKSGQIIILKEWKESFVEYGNIYLIITISGHRMVKYLRRGETNDTYICASENEKYESFEIKKGDILRLFIVKGSIQKNTL